MLTIKTLFAGSVLCGALLVSGFARADQANSAGMNEKALAVGDKIRGELAEDKEDEAVKILDFLRTKSSTFCQASEAGEPDQQTCSQFQAHYTGTAAWMKTIQKSPFNTDRRVLGYAVSADKTDDQSDADYAIIWAGNTPENYVLSAKCPAEMSMRVVAKTAHCSSNTAEIGKAEGSVVPESDGMLCGFAATCVRNRFTEKQ